MYAVTLETILNKLTNFIDSIKTNMEIWHTLSVRRVSN